MFSKHVKKRPRLVITLTKLENIQPEKISDAVSKSIKNKLFTGSSLVSLATAFLAFSIVFL